ncbi:MAG: hypothetical protein EBU88_17270, partial [Acidobacteria bacterium]|nr:hypothetical protein [Acidobacteriota bacterium]
MTNRGEQLEKMIDQIRQRRNMLIRTKGITITVAMAAVSTLLLGLIGYRYRQYEWLLYLLRIITVTLVAGTAYFGLWRPMRRKVRPEQIARLIEERVPGLDDRFVTATEVAQISPSNLGREGLQERLLTDVNERAAAIDPDQILPRRRVLNWGVSALLVTACFIGLLVYGPQTIRVGVAGLVAPGASVAATGALLIEVSPAGARIARGNDQRVTAKIINSAPPEATLFFRPAEAGEEQWIGQPMEPGRQADQFQGVLFNVLKDTEYFVEIPGCRSEVYRLKVVDRPLVSRIDQVLEYPAYTGLATRKIDDAPEIAVLAGTRVTLKTKLSAPAKAAAIVLATGTRIIMDRSAADVFNGTIPVTTATTYHIELTSLDDQTYNGSNEYDILILEDRPPSVVFEKPGRDARASSVEEIFTLARAEDDYGVAALSLHFSVNGGEEKKIDLLKLPAETPRALAGSHTFFLEEFGLQPG